MKLWNKMICGYAVVGATLLPTTVAFGASHSAPSIHWHVIKAETYTFWDKDYDTIMRGLNIWISSPGYFPSIGPVVADATQLQLIDEQGHSYLGDFHSATAPRSDEEFRWIKNSDYKKVPKGVHILNFTSIYSPIPYAKVGHIKLRFPLEFYSVQNENDPVETVKFNAIVTHHP